MKDRHGIVTLRPTSSPRVMIGEWAGWRLYVRDAEDGLWDATGRVYPTKAEAFANVLTTEAVCY